jgi:phospholipid/cholesterol/gamma-HCH transport system substrate-binding protein
VRSKANLPLVIGYMLTSLIVLGVIVAQLGVTLPWQRPYTLTVEFADTSGVLSSNEVDMNGARIGRVGDVSAAHGQGKVQLIIDNPSALPIYDNATAEVRTKNLLGETYIDLQRGTSRCATCTLSSGATLDASHTVPITEIDQVLSIFDPTTVHRVQFIIDALGRGTTNNGTNMNSGATSARALVTSLNGPAVELSVRRQQVADITIELQRLYDMLAKQRAEVRQAVGTWNDVMAQFAAQDDSVATSLQQADTLLAKLNTVLANEGTNLQTTLTELPSAINDTNQFLEQSNSILGSVLPYRGSIHDVFPNLASSFADTDANGQHFWSVYSVGCYTDCSSATPQGTSSGAEEPPAMEAGWSLQMLEGYR